jgi:maltodextrin utilization protein YvdJ
MLKLNQVQKILFFLTNLSRFRAGVMVFLASCPLLPVSLHFVARDAGSIGLWTKKFRCDFINTICETYV